MWQTSIWSACFINITKVDWHSNLLYLVRIICVAVNSPQVYAHENILKCFMKCPSLLPIELILAAHAVWFRVSINVKKVKVIEMHPLKMALIIWVHLRAHAVLWGTPSYSTIWDLMPSIRIYIPLISVEPIYLIELWFYFTCPRQFCLIIV